MSFKNLLLRFAGIAVAGIAVVRADVTVPALFLRSRCAAKGGEGSVWGKATPGEAVTVTLDKATASAKTGDDGKWKAVLDLHAEGPGPYSLTIQGKNAITVSGRGGRRGVALRRAIEHGVFRWERFRSRRRRCRRRRIRCYGTLR